MRVTSYRSHLLVATIILAIQGCAVNQSVPGRDTPRSVARAPQCNGCVDTTNDSGGTGGWTNYSGSSCTTSWSSDSRVSYNVQNGTARIGFGVPGVVTDGTVNVIVNFIDANNVIVSSQTYNTAYSNQTGAPSGGYVDVTYRGGPFASTTFGFNFVDVNPTGNSFGAGGGSSGCS